MHHVAILDDYQNAALGSADWTALGDAPITVFDRHLGHDDAGVVEVLRPFSIIVAMRERTPFSRARLEQLPNLRLLVTAGMRNLAIDLDAARELGIDVCGTEMLGYPAYEHTWALILALAKQIPREDRAMKAGGWQQGYGVGLNGKTLGILGLGRLGQRVARVALAFDMRVIAWSQNLTEEKAGESSVTRVEKDALFAQADFLTIHLVLGDRTRGLVGRRELDLVKSSAYLINTSRGPIVDEAALVDALAAHRLAGAALDVYAIEPLPPEHPLRRLDNVVLTGHTGFVVEEFHRLVYGQALEDIAAWQAGAPLRRLNAAPP